MTQYVSGGERTAPPEDLTLLGKAAVLATGVRVPRPESELGPEALARDARDLRIESTDDVTLAVWYVDRGVSTPLVILFHGYAAEKSSLLPEARALLAMGASVMLVDFRGSGGSSADYTTVGVREADDVAAAMAYAMRSTRHRATILYGKSMGAAAILRSARVHGVAPDAVILEAVFDTLPHTVDNRFHAMGLPAFPASPLLVYWGGRQWGFDGAAHRPVDDARALHCTALVMHGTVDPRATLAEGRRVYDALPGPKTFLAFPGVGHASYLESDPDAWRAAVAPLFALGGAFVPQRVPYPATGHNASGSGGGR
jgi:pimeloyl-ACP methyl ester carboxylesterase